MHQASVSPQTDPDKGGHSVMSTSTKPAFLVAAGTFVLSALLRIPHLGRVPNFTFDEAYYVPQGYSMTEYGYERHFADGGQDAFGTHALDKVFTTGGDFVVHPPLGKWLIGLGELAGPTETWTWRISAVIAGSLVAALVALMAWHLSHSWKWSALAGGLASIEGMIFVESRTGILDIFLTLFVVAGAAAAFKDRDSLATGWWRPWRIAASMSFGLATGVKFSGVIFLIAYLWLTIAWDLRKPGSTVEALGRTARNFVLVPVSSAVMYILTWTGWFLTDGGYGRHSKSNIVASWLHTQIEMLTLAGAIETPHNWQSGPWAWLIQWRPTMFYTVTEPCEGDQGSTCYQIVTSLGTVPIWIAGILALIALGWLLARFRDRDSALILAWVAAGYLPWWFFSGRTIYAFYVVVVAPFVILAIIVVLLRLHRSEHSRSSLARPIAVGLAIAAVVWFWLYYPVYTAEIISDGTYSRLLFWKGWR